MHANGEKADDRRNPMQRRPAPSAARNGSGPAAQLLALQSSVGNAAVVQLLREAGDPWLAGKHQHGAGCEHGVPAVQRSSVADVLRGSGRPLDSATRDDMQTRFGADFPDVRVHDDAAARASAAEIGARAYTSGNHIVLGEGGADRHTLAHELTHVIQQRRGPVAGADNGSGLKMSDPSDRFERQAEANARRVMSGGPSLLTPAHVQRAGGAHGGERAGGIQRTHYPHGEEVRANPSYCVILAASLNGVRLGHFTSQPSYGSEQDHAEDQLCDEIESAILFASSGHVGIATSGAGGDILRAITQRMDREENSHTLRVVLSASPCSRRRGTTTKENGYDGCAERLIRLARMRFGRHGDQRIEIKISAHHPYQPHNMTRREAIAASQAAMADMRAAGIEIDAG